MRAIPRRLGTSVVTTVTLLAAIACAHSLMARTLEPIAEPPVTESPGADEESTADLPSTPAPQIDSITLFPNQGEIPDPHFEGQRFGYVLHGQWRAAYDSNIFISANHEQADFIFTISPGVAVGWGEFKSELYGPESVRHRFDPYGGKDYFYLDYSPSYTWFADHGDEDSFNHAARFVGEWTIRRLTLGAHASFVTENVADEDLGARVDRRTTAVALTSRFDSGAKTNFEINAYYSGLDYDSEGVDSREWRNEDWLNYQIATKVKVGLGGTFAYVDRETGPAQQYEQARLRLIYEATERLTAGVTGGAEWRQTDDGEDRSDGIFQLDLAWMPFDGSYFYLQGFRRSVTSGRGASDYYIATGVSARYRQRFLQRYYFSLTAGYQNSDYQDTPGAEVRPRTDDLYFVRPGVGFDLTTWLNCEVTGEYRHNDSTIEKHGFAATRAMVRFNLLF